MRHRRLAILLAILVTIPVLQAGPLPNAPGTWKPWKPFSAVASTRSDRAASPALVKAFEAEMLALNAILRRAQGVASPVGFSVETWGSLSGYRPAEQSQQRAGSVLPLAGALTFGAFPIFEYERNGKTIREDTGETALQQFHINEIGHGLIDRGNVLEWSGVDHDAFLQPLPDGEIAGLPKYGDGLVIARDPAALWSPLTRRAALELVVKSREKDVAGFEESVSAANARLAVVRDPAWRAGRIKEAQQAAASMPNPQAFVKQIEESIRIEEASLVKEVSPASGSGKNLADARNAVAEVTSWIAEMSPAEQAGPACYVSKGATLRTKFPRTAGAGCHPLVRPNYAYFNKALPRSAPQVIVITPIARCFNTADKYNTEANSASPAGCRANRALIETLDKPALRAWLR